MFYSALRFTTLGIKGLGLIIFELDLDINILINLLSIDQWSAGCIFAGKFFM